MTKSPTVADSSIVVTTMLNRTEEARAKSKILQPKAKPYNGNMSISQPSA